MKTITEYLINNHVASPKKLSEELDYVDLDLPSGNLWTTMNIGAEEGKNPEDWYGLYFAWGDVKGYKEADKHMFNWDTYKFGTQDNLTKYNKKDKLIQLENYDDVVYQNTNGKFRMPTDDNFEELAEYTDNKWVKDYNGIKGLNGIMFTSKQDKTKYIFIPASGYNNFRETPNTGDCLCLWASTRSSNSKHAAYFFANKYEVKVYGNTRCLGYAIRGVLNK